MDKTASQRPYYLVFSGRIYFVHLFHVFHAPIYIYSVLEQALRLYESFGQSIFLIWIDRSAGQATQVT
jgi:hypothetical protein